MAERSFCALTSERLEEDPVGTASTVRAFLLVEHGGPWGVKALRDAAFPDPVRDLLRGLSGVRAMTMRRPGSRPGVPQRPRIVLAACAPTGGLAAQTRLDSVDDLAALPVADLVAGLRAGPVPDGWEPVRRFLGTCTHGRHDACCAERGRPVAAALHELVGDDAWEVSHMGGDRFAGNVLSLPDGLYYGRVTPEDAAELVAAGEQGRVVTRLLRGRTSLSFPAQAAEVALRRHLDAEAAADVVLTAVTEHESRTVTTWDVVGRGAWRVVVDSTSPGPPRSLTCSAEPTNPPVRTVVELAPADAPGRGVQGWDDAYRAGDGDDAAREPSPTVIQALESLPAGRALDLAAGTGRHAVWLARHGWQVTAVDFSPVGVARGHAASDAADVAVDWHLGDARVWAPASDDPGYDLVLLAYVGLPDVVARAAGWLAPGGRLVVVGHALRNLTDGDPRGPRDPRLLHTPEALRDNASGLTVERLEELERSTDLGQLIEAVLVARRP